MLEYRLDFGPGYRVYFGRDGDVLAILLAGGTKKRQQRPDRQPAGAQPVQRHQSPAASRQAYVARDGAVALTVTALAAGCVEAATMAGMQTARALCG